MMIKSNRETEFPAFTSDYLPTFLDIIGMAHPQPGWARLRIPRVCFVF